MTRNAKKSLYVKRKSKLTYSSLLKTWISAWRPDHNTLTGINIIASATTSSASSRRKISKISAPISSFKKGPNLDRTWTELILLLHGDWCSETSREWVHGSLSTPARQFASLLSPQKCFCFKRRGPTLKDKNKITNKAVIYQKLDKATSNLIERVAN